MVKFLINRPIAVIMAFTAIFILGIITYLNIPVSLLPDIAIPEITVQVQGSNQSSRELENTVVSPIRQYLLQTSELRDIRTETRNGNAILRLSFEYGTDTELAFVEVNEKIDAAMNSIPKGTERPRVIKASATDIPVQYLNISLKKSHQATAQNEEDFIELSEFVENVIKRRIEQLPEISMVDITGLVSKQIVIVPDSRLMEVGDITLTEIETALNSNNVEPGSMSVRDGHYEYNIRFSSVIRTLDDIRNIYIRKNDRIYKLSDLAQVNYAPEKEKGMAMFGDKRCIKMSIIKQSGVKMADMQESLDKLIKGFRNGYPDISFDVSENQTALLDYTLMNLKQNILLAFLFVWLISVVFMKDFKSPLIIGICMIVALVSSLLLFYLFGISLNIISLTGLVLASGNIIDNSIIVTDNITQYRNKGYSTEEACIRGTNEVITPMLSSSLTNVSVFVPLVFMSGIAGALFFDQAFSVTAGLLVSYIIGIMLLPVLYKLFQETKWSKLRLIQWLQKRKKNKPFQKATATEEAVPDSLMLRMYDKGIGWVFRHKVLTIVSMMLTIPLGLLIFIVMPKEKMPDINQNELMVHIDWNENLHIQDNYEKTEKVLRFIKPDVAVQSALSGQQQFLLSRDQELTASETEIYLKVEDTDRIPDIKKKINGFIEKNYSGAIVSFTPAGTLFEKIFRTGEPDLVVEYYAKNTAETPEPTQLRQVNRKLYEKTGEKPNEISFQKQLSLKIDREKLLYYNISYNEVYQTLKTAFKENQFATLRSYQQYLPIVLGSEDKTVDEILKQSLIKGSDNPNGTHNRLALDQFVQIIPTEDMKVIVAGDAGEYVPFTFSETKKPEKIITAAKEEAAKDGTWDVGFSGIWFSNKKMIGELMIILLISVLLMYFILTAQFESFVQPLIVMFEIPIDITASLGLLYVLGHSLNLMSAIGIVVTCGIIVNDSILKVDIMNQLRSEGYKLMDAIHEAGRRRLNAILMTSITSIVCMVPLLFSFDMGSELEKPLALATIGGMLAGTPVTLFVVPLVYWWIYRKEEK